MVPANTHPPNEPNKEEDKETDEENNSLVQPEEKREGYQQVTLGA